MIAVEQHFRLDDRHDAAFLTQRCVARQRVGVGLQTSIGGNAVADGNHGAPLGELGAKLTDIL